ncbi:MAG: hypothetical protein U9R20_03670, partial [Thermodesulfobacteriota bacterium]|nr:hypothetical protein [Thermodesulfobacteriota bacterium]
MRYSKGVTMSFFSTRKKECIETLEKAVDQDTIDLDHVSEIMADSYYQEELLRTANTRGSEKRVLREMEAKAEQLLADLDDETKTPDLGGLKWLVTLTPWQLFHSEKK